MIFVGYDDKCKTFRCFNPDTKKLVISRDVRFLDKCDNTLKNENDSLPLPIILNNTGAVYDSSEIDIAFDNPQSIQPNNDQNTIEFEDKEIPMEATRISQPANKGVTPQKLVDKMNAIYNKMTGMEWIRIMEDEMAASKKNKTWELCELPKDRTVIPCKWI